MKIHLFLIILGFTRIIGSQLSNVTYDDSYPVCPINLVRRKRAQTIYTRWRANEEPTPEFLVKVLDDELTTTITKQVVAVNIQPVASRTEKIKVGGVIVPPVTLPSVPDGIQDYTRFVPPTTTSPHVGEIFTASQNHQAIDQLPPIKPLAGRHSQRDESPPASPQFLARSTDLHSWQYAPIAPVAFTRQQNITPRRPTPSHDLFDTIEFIAPPTRTSTFPNIEIPKRTRHDSEEFREFIKEKISESSKSRSSFDVLYSPYRTSTAIFSINPEPFTSLITDRNVIEENKEKSKIYEKMDKDTDSVYNMLLYGDEENSNNNRKEEQDKDTEFYDDPFTKHTESDKSTLMDIDEAELDSNITNNNTDYVDESDNNITIISPIRRLFSPIIETTIDSESMKTDEKLKSACNLIKLRQLNFNSPRTLAEIVAQLKQWAENSPLVKWEDITNGNLTTMENPIYMMIIDDLSSGQIVTAKQTVMVVAGILGRDHHAVAAAMYVLYQLIERSESHTDLLSKYRFWIVPVFNPDGYDYSMTFPHRREWSKNLRQNWELCRNRDSCSACELYGLRCTVQPCYGVNLDRNFEYQWIPTEELRAEHPCGSLHAGTRQLSEPETRALTTFLHEKRTPLFAFIAFKEGEVLGIMYPYSHTRKLRAFDNVYRQRASRAASAAYSISGRPYVAGPTSEFLPLYAGGIEDWVDGHLGIDNTYTIMMFRPTDSYNSKLITERVVHEAYAAMDTLLLQSMEHLDTPSIVTLKRVNSSASAHLASYTIIILLTIICRGIINYR